METTIAQHFRVDMISTHYMLTTSGKTWIVKTRVDLQRHDPQHGWVPGSQTFDCLQDAEAYKLKLETELVEPKNAHALELTENWNNCYILYSVEINYGQHAPLICVF